MLGRKKHRDKGVETMVGPNTEISGDLRFEGWCHVDGTVNGNITANPDTDSHLSISEDANVDGGVTVPNVQLNGIVRGDVYASERVELGPTARVIGNVYYNLIEMAIGAEINGKLVHKPEGQVTLISQSTRIDNTVAIGSER
jgi:cytoskeletal protein CcmA (bactofilin family)